MKFLITLSVFVALCLPQAPGYSESLASVYRHRFKPADIYAIVSMHHIDIPI